jgi:ABC-type transport system involved in Fe-S cluster assembly fused permease/ATPase subunit
MDGDGFILEANTQSKYKIVSACPYDKSKFNDACAELVKYAKLENKLGFNWDDTAVTVDSSTIETIDTTKVKLPNK